MTHPLEATRLLVSQGDSYETAANCPLSWLARISPWPELSFYLPVLRIVLRSSLRAGLGRYDGARWAESSLNIVQAMEGVGMRLTIEGLGNLRRFEGPAVFVANHMSTLETFVLPCLIQPLKPVTFVVKESLVRYPVFGPIMRSRDPIVVGRMNPREDLTAVFKGGEERLRRGISIIVFPQGTRFETLAPEQFNSMGAKLAARAGVPLVPVALDTLAWGTGKGVKDFGRVDPGRPVHFRFGDPLPPEGKGAQAHEACLRFILDSVRGWQSRAPGRPAEETH